MSDQELLQYCNDNLVYDPDSGVITSKIKEAVLDRKAPNGYRQISISGKRYYSHRIAYLITYKELPKRIDHINHCRSDNSIGNLRSCTHAENTRNRGPNKYSQSGYKGVVFHNIGKKWLAQIVYNGKNIYLGLHVCKHEAARAYNLAARMYHGKFAYTNKVTS